MSIEEYRERMRAYREQLKREVDAASEKAGPEAVGDEDAQRQEALGTLADDAQPVERRAFAAEWLKALSFSSPTLGEWLPNYLDALRSASNAEEPALRELAFETLVSFRDRGAQERLVAGLDDPPAAQVPADVALRLLSLDPHAPARDAALAYADADDESTRVEALRVLASDPASVDRFAGLLADGSQPEAVRTLSATALSHLDRGRLRTVASEMREKSAGPESASDADVETHVKSLLELPE